MASILKRWVVSTPDNCWREVSCAVEPAGGEVGLQVTSSGEQTWEGFGGCFNELGWIALLKL
ncbi:MAG: beta-glycosidase, partial [Chloroflexota bacterium]|nr:beta-glycosidase [Chloroflexota bacterium]